MIDSRLLHGHHLPALGDNSSVDLPRHKPRLDEAAIDSRPYFRRPRLSEIAISGGLRRPRVRKESRLMHCHRSNPTTKPKPYCLSVHKRGQRQDRSHPITKPAYLVHLLMGEVSDRKASFLGIEFIYVITSEGEFLILTAPKNRAPFRNRCNTYLYARPRRSHRDHPHLRNFRRGETTTHQSRTSWFHRQAELTFFELLHPVFFEFVQRNLAGLFFTTIPTNDLVVFLFFVFSAVRCTLRIFWDFSPTLTPTDARTKKKPKKTTRSFSGIVMKNNPVKIRFTTRKNQGANVIPVGSKLFPKVCKKAQYIVLVLWQAFRTTPLYGSQN